jgi:hypoxanthine phosphoribosyltransferase
MAETPPQLEILLPREEVQVLVRRLAERIAPQITDDTVAVCLLVGGLWFAADLTRALADFGRPLAFDSLWLSSYRDGTKSLGRCEVRADLQRSIEGRPALVIDDVFDTGLSLDHAVKHLQSAGASDVKTAVFASKPWPQTRALAPDYVAWEAPSRFLLGYGMDHGGLYRGLSDISAVVEA